VAWGGGQNERGDYGVRGALGDEDRRGWVEESLDSDDDEQVRVTKGHWGFFRFRESRIQADLMVPTTMLVRQNVEKGGGGWSPEYRRGENGKISWPIFSIIGWARSTSVAGAWVALSLSLLFPFLLVWKASKFFVVSRMLFFLPTSYRTFSA
jgi:hypothetical protein